jgi:hypothetical protein
LYFNSGRNPETDITAEQKPSNKEQKPTCCARELFAEFKVNQNKGALDEPKTGNEYHAHYKAHLLRMLEGSIQLNAPVGLFPHLLSVWWNQLPQNHQELVCLFIGIGHNTGLPQPPKPIPNSIIPYHHASTIPTVNLPMHPGGI